MEFLLLSNYFIIEIIAFRSFLKFVLLKYILIFVAFFLGIIRARFLWHYLVFTVNHPPFVRSLLVHIIQGIINNISCQLFCFVTAKSSKAGRRDYILKRYFGIILYPQFEVICRVLIQRIKKNNRPVFHPTDSDSYTKSERCNQSINKTQLCQLDSQIFLEDSAITLTMGVVTSEKIKVSIFLFSKNPRAIYLFL